MHHIQTSLLDNCARMHLVTNFTGLAVMFVNKKTATGSKFHDEVEEDNHPTFRLIVRQRPAPTGRRIRC